MIRVLSATDVADVLDLEALLDVVERGLVKQTRGAVERPDRPHYPVGAGLAADGRDTTDEPLGTGLAMPAYVHGASYMATKLASVHAANPERGLPTVHAQLVLAEADTGRPAAFVEGTTITNARTGCIGGVAVRALTDGPIELGVLGAGAQARWQTRAIGAAVDVDAVRVYAPSDSREACASDLRDDGFDAEAVASPEAAVANADVVVTATTSHDPVFPADALPAEAVVVAIGAYTAEMQELEPAVLEGASRVYADVPTEVAAIGDVQQSELDEAALVPLGALLAGEDEPPAGRIVVESVGSAVLDAVAGEHLLDRALEADVGTTVEFS